MAIEKNLESNTRAYKANIVEKKTESISYLIATTLAPTMTPAMKNMLV